MKGVGCCPERGGIRVEPTVVLCSQLLELYRSRNQVDLPSLLITPNDPNIAKYLAIFISSPCKSRYYGIGDYDPTGVVLFTRGTVIVPLDFKQLSYPSSKIHASF